MKKLQSSLLSNFINLHNSFCINHKWLRHPINVKRCVYYVWVKSKSAHTPRADPLAFDIFDFFGQIPYHEGHFLGQIPSSQGILRGQMPAPPPPPPPRAVMDAGTFRSPSPGSSTLEKPEPDRVKSEFNQVFKSKVIGFVCFLRKNKKKTQEKLCFIKKWCHHNVIMTLYGYVT